MYIEAFAIVLAAALIYGLGRLLWHFLFGDDGFDDFDDYGW